MAEEIGKLAVSLSMDDDQFNSSISGINRSLKVLGSEFGTLKSQGADFGNSIEGLAQRQDLLGRTLTVQEAKVKQLRDAYERSAAESGEYSDATQRLAQQLNNAVGAYNRTETELNQVNSALNEQRAEAAQAESAWGKFQTTMEGVSKKLQDVGQKMKDVGGNMTAGVTAPLAGLGAGAIMAADDVDSANGRIQAQLGLTAEESERVGDVAQTLFRDAFGGSMEEAADSVANVVKNMKEITPDELQVVAEQAMTVADVFGQDINDVTKTADQLMVNFGISSTEAFDLMTAGFQNGLDFSGEMLDTLNEYAPQFSSLGFSGEEFFNTLAAGAEAGAFNLDKVGDAVKEFNIRAKDGSKTTSEAFDLLGMDAEEMAQTFAKGGPEAQKAFQTVVQELSKIEDPVLRNTIGVGLFGTQFEDLEADVIAAMGTTKGEFDDVAGSTQAAGDAMYDNFGTRLTSVFRELQTALLPLGTVLLDMAEAVMPKLQTAVQAVAKWFSNMSPAGQQMTVIFGMIAAAIGPLLVVFGTIAGAIGNLIPVVMKVLPYLSKMRTVFTVIRTAMLALTGPIGIAIAIITALGVVIYQNWDTIKAKTIEVWNYLKTAIPEAWTAIKAKAVEIFNAIKATIISIWDGVKNYFAAVLIATKFVFTSAWNGIKAATTTVFNAIKATIQAIWNGIKSYFIFVLNTYKTIFTTAWNGIKAVTSTVFNAIKATIQAIWNGIKAYFTTLLSVYRTIFTTGWNAIKSVTSSVFNAVKSVIQSIWNSIRSTITSVINAIRSAVTNGWNSIRSAVTSVMNSIKSGVLAAWNGIRSGIVTTVNGIRSTVSSVFSSVKSAIVNPIQSAKSTVIGIIDSIKGAFSRMRITIPKPKLPKVSVSMGSKEVGGISIPFPKFDVSWFAKGGVFNGPSVVGLGEDGPEAIVPLQGANMRPFAEAIASAMPGGTGGGHVTVEVPIYLDGYMIAKASQPYIDMNQQSKTQMKAYMKGVK